MLGILTSEAFLREHKKSTTRCFPSVYCTCELSHLNLMLLSLTCLGRCYNSPPLNSLFFPLIDFLCIPTPNAGQLNPVFEFSFLPIRRFLVHSDTEVNPLFHTFAEFRLVMNRVAARQSTDWLAANAQFSPKCTYLNLRLRSFS